MVQKVELEKTKVASTERRRVCLKENNKPFLHTLNTLSGILEEYNDKNVESFECGN